MPRATKKASRKKAAARKSKSKSKSKSKGRSKSKDGKPGRSRLKARAAGNGGGSALAFFFFVCLSLAAAVAVVIEVRNYIEFPSVEQYGNFRGDVSLTLYHRGAARRSAVVFMEGGGVSNKPRFITRLFYLEENGQRGSATERFEELGWSSDGGAVFATRQSDPSQVAVSAMPEILWLYDIDSSVFYRVIDSAIPGRGAEASQNFLQRYLYERKGGPGKVIAHWFDLGRKENYAFSWQSTRWNRASEAAGSRDG